MDPMLLLPPSITHPALRLQLQRLLPLRRDENFRSFLPDQVREGWATCSSWFLTEVSGHWWNLRQGKWSRSRGEEGRPPAGASRGLGRLGLALQVCRCLASPNPQEQPPPQMEGPPSLPSAGGKLPAVLQGGYRLCVLRSAGTSLSVALRIPFLAVLA